MLALVPFLLAYLALQIWQTAVLFKYSDKLQAQPATWPEITIMVAARNEEANLEKCLKALCDLQYPKDKVKILIGNDQSTDRTQAIALLFQSNYENIKLIDIQDDLTGLKAKARVMAQLDKHATGEFYLVTDADVVVKPTWASTMVRHMDSITGVASGTTMVTGNQIGDQMQGIDWAYFMGLLNVISYSGVPATAVGNNMIIRADAYWQTGGYGRIKFSITEDYKLYDEVCKLGWKWNNIMTPEVLAYSKATIGLLPLLHQRKRWLSGGRDLPWYWWIFFGVFGLYYFLLPIAMVLYPLVTIPIALAKFTLQNIQIARIFKCVDEPKPSILKLLIYEFYLFAITILTALFSISPLKTIWKGRKY